MAKLATKAEILPVTIPEHGLVQADSLTIVGFLNGLVQFFRGAAVIEATAKEALASARLLTLPKPGDVDGDGELQRIIKANSAGKKAAEKYWDITIAVTSLRNKLSIGRSRPVRYYEEAGQIAQQLHNTFTEDARRRAAEEQERLRREAEAREAAKRRLDLDRMEAEALAREAVSADLSAREQRFVEELVKHREGTYGTQEISQAARLAGYKDTIEHGRKLMKFGKIVAAIQARRDAQEIRRQAEAVATAPLDVQVETVKVQKVSVGSDRTTYTMDIFDPRLLVEAVVGGRHGIPADILAPDQTRANAYARDLRDVVNRWPGCRLVRKTTTV